MILSKHSVYTVSQFIPWRHPKETPNTPPSRHRSASAISVKVRPHVLCWAPRFPAGRLIHASKYSPLNITHFENNITEHWTERTTGLRLVVRGNEAMDKCARRSGVWSGKPDFSMSLFALERNFGVSQQVALQSLVRMRRAFPWLGTFRKFGTRLFCFSLLWWFWQIFPWGERVLFVKRS